MIAKLGSNKKEASLEDTECHCWRNSVKILQLDLRDNVLISFQCNLGNET